MPAQKKSSVTQTGRIIFTVCAENKKALAYFERYVMLEKGIENNMEVRNADIVNRALNIAHQHCLKRRNNVGRKKN